MMYKVRNNKIVIEERDVEQEIKNFINAEALKYIKELKAVKEFNEKGKTRKLKK